MAALSRSLGTLCFAAASAVAVGVSVRAIGPNDYSFTTLAGSAGQTGSIDATGGDARFSSPRGLAVDADGNLYVADRDNHTIRKVTPTGVVTTLAGTQGVPGSTDANGTAAQFAHPWGVAVDGFGSVYVSDADNNTIRKIAPNGDVTTLAGSAGQQGSTDANGSAARFRSPRRPAVDAAGNVYVADRDNHTIRKIAPNGDVTTLAGSAGETGSTDATGSDARFNLPSGVAVDPAGNVYVADTNNHVIRKITPGGVMTTLAGSALQSGSTDGLGSAARFSEPEAVAVDATGRVFVADTDNSTIRRITPAGDVATIGGLAGATGSTDDRGDLARFDLPRGIAADSSGVIYVSDTDNHTIRRGLAVTATITGQPASQTVPFGSTTTLSVTVGGPGPFTYQWYSGAGGSAVPIGGATGSTYTPPAMTGSRSYWVRITNAEGFADSLVVTITATGLGVQTLQNADFSAGAASWFVHELPDMVFSVVDGVFRFHKAAPLTTASGQATVFQNTGLAVAGGQGLVAQFDIGNGDAVRKRISVLVLDSDFSDLSVCTFWLPPNAPLATYQMNTHPTRNWTNASIYFYAASTGVGDYLLDNVSLQTANAASSSRTECLDPYAPGAPGGGPGPTLLTNGDFETGALAPWGVVFDLEHQITGGVFEFYRPGAQGVPAGALLQPTSQATAAGEILTATFQLGNSSGVRKRATILLHDLDFSDLAACTFWIEPGQALSNFAMRTYATRAWANATLSVYAATKGPEQWTQLDNVTLTRTPGSALLGTECLEPGSAEAGVRPSSR